MLKYDIINVSESIDTNIAGASNKCTICHFWYFLKMNFRF